MPWLMGSLGALSSCWNVVLHPAHQPNAIFLLLHGCFFALGVFLYEVLLRGWTLPRTLGLVASLPGCLAEVGQHRQIPADALWIAGILFLVLSVAKNGRAHALTGSHGALMVRKIGLITYPLYLVHDVVGTLLLVRLRQFGLSDGAALLCTIGAMVAVAALVVQFGEPWLGQRVRRLFPGTTPGVMSPTHSPAAHTR